MNVEQPPELWEADTDDSRFLPLLGEMIAAALRGVPLEELTLNASSVVVELPDDEEDIVAPLPGEYVAILSHNPDTAEKPGWGSYAGWILAGHTHGGQCKPPFLPPPLLPVKNRRFASGEYELTGGRRMYINRGVGHLLKVRFNVRPEVTVFHLIPA